MQKERKRINIVDIIIIFVILAVAAFFGLKFFGGMEKTIDNPGQITFTVLVEAVPVESYENIKDTLPSKTIANGSYIDCEIKSVTAEPCTVNKIEKSNGSNPYVVTEIAPSGEFVNLTFTITATVNLDSILTEVGTQEVRVGRSHIVKTKQFEFTGTILTVDRTE